MHSRGSTIRMVDRWAWLAHSCTLAKACLHPQSCREVPSRYQVTCSLLSTSVADSPNRSHLPQASFASTAALGHGAAPSRPASVLSDPASDLPSSPRPTELPSSPRPTESPAVAGAAEHPAPPLAEEKPKALPQTNPNSHHTHFFFVQTGIKVSFPCWPCPTSCTLRVDQCLFIRTHPLFAILSPAYLV